MKKLYFDQYGNEAPSDAQYFDTRWKQFIKIEDDVLHVNECGAWVRSEHSAETYWTMLGAAVKL